MVAAVGRNVTGLLFSMSSGVYSQGVLSVATSATAIPLGQVASCGWAFFYNSDSANYVTLRNGSSGADWLRLNAGECAFGPLITSCVPYGVANTSAVLLEFLIFSR